MILVVGEKVSIARSGRVTCMKHGPPAPIVVILIVPIEVAGPQYLNGSQ